MEEEYKKCPYCQTLLVMLDEEHDCKRRWDQ